MSRDHNEGDNGALSNLAAALGLFRAETAQALPVQVVQAFALVAAEEGKSLSAYAEALGSNMSSASRHFMALTSRSLPDFQGHGLITAKEDATDMRKKNLWLTERGQKLKDGMVAILND